MRQVFIARDMLNEAQFERKLYVIRKLVEKAVRANRPFRAANISTSPVCPSARSSTKGCLPHQMGAYYQDLTDASMVSALALVHSRFSTNTFPTWPLAHPYRHICHNGEINTLKGNVNWMKARQGRLHSDLFGKDMEKVFPIVYEQQSDSACLDNALEFLLLGAGLPHAMMMLIPEPGWPMRRWIWIAAVLLSRRHDGAPGTVRPRLFHGRQDDRRDAGPQRFRPCRLSGHHGRHGRAGVGSGDCSSRRTRSA